LSPRDGGGGRGNGLAGYIQRIRPGTGYDWLREKIAEHDFKSRGCDVDASEIFISDGSKCDCGNILDIFGNNNTIAVTDPVYPVYVDTNVMAGHTGDANEQGEYGGLVYLPITAENNFTAQIPTDQKVDLIYLCFRTIRRAQLQPKNTCKLG
jgi:LL-diaminopimelate aminotransferase apoenzyme (EC 2.6.1.83)